VIAVAVIFGLFVAFALGWAVGNTTGWRDGYLRGRHGGRWSR
jgi:hypothetical protein